MDKIKHKLMGEGTIVKRDGNKIDIKFDKTGKILNCIIPGSFASKLWTLSGPIKDEVDYAQKELDEKNSAEIQKTVDEITAKTTAVASTPTRSSGKAKKTAAKTIAKHPTDQAYYDHLVASGYIEETPAGADSTAPTYVKRINKILKEESLTWDDLPDEIGRLITLYDKGGAKEKLGAKSNRTPINALYRFRDFLNKLSITP